MQRNFADGEQEIIDVPPGPVDQRAALADRYISSWLDPGRTGSAPE